MIRIIQEILNRIRFMFQRLNRLLFVKKQIKEIRPLCWETGAAVFRLKSGILHRNARPCGKIPKSFLKCLEKYLQNAVK